MGSGLIQLVSYGKEKLYLLGIYNFFLPHHNIYIYIYYDVLFENGN
jgi:hypothetical protein